MLPHWSFEHALAYKTHQLVSLMDRIAARALEAELNLTYPQFLILITLQHRSALSQKAVAETLHISEPAICRQIEILIGKAYLSRKPFVDDRRQYQLRFTETGKRQLVRALAVLEETFSDVYQPFEALRQRQALALLDQLLSATRIHPFLRSSSIKFKRGGE